MRLWSPIGLVLQLIALLQLANAAWGNECGQLQQLAQQSMQLYHNGSNLRTGGGGDPAQLAAAQNYQNAYTACVSAGNARAFSTPSVGGRAGAVMNGMSGMMGILGILNSMGNDNSSSQPPQQPAMDYGQQLREQQERERQQREQAAKEQRERDEQARLAALEADRQARCSTPNSFGASTGCGAAANPFETGSAFGAAKNPFAESASAAGSARFATTGASGAGKTQPAARSASGKNSQVADPSGAPSLPESNNSVAQQGCGPSITTNCNSGAQAMLLGATCLNALQNGLHNPACQYTPANYSSAVLSVAQYRQIAAQYRPLSRSNGTFDPDVLAHLNHYYLPYQIPTPDDPGVVYYEPSPLYPSNFEIPTTDPPTPQDEPGVVHYSPSALSPAASSSVPPAPTPAPNDADAQASAAAQAAAAAVDQAQQKINAGLGTLTQSNGPDGPQPVANVVAPSPGPETQSTPQTANAKKSPCDVDDYHHMQFDDPDQLARHDACLQSHGP